MQKFTWIYLAEKKSLILGKKKAPHKSLVYQLYQLLGFTGSFSVFQMALILLRSKWDEF